MPKRPRRVSEALRQSADHLGRRSQASHRREHFLNHPRPLTDRERTLIFLYSYCQLGMTPQQFYSKWDVTYEDIALICCRSHSAVRRWFQRGHRHSPPHANDLRHLALMDFMLEHFEEIPKSLFDMLCFPR
ncbi:MAG TPA: hypothetical protein V6D48_05385 [Oculatellaceae cyanobacterium]